MGKLFFPKRCRVHDYIVTISFGRILHYGGFNLFCDVSVCVCLGFVMCRRFGNTCTCIYCALYCMYCAFCIVSFMYIRICFVYTSVRTTATE